MGKMKVHELAKELNLTSKELVEKLIELKYDVKSHLSILEDSDVEKIKKQLKTKTKKAEVAPKDDKTAAKKEKKPIAPVIIRREVTRIETIEEPKKVEVKGERRNDLGVVQRRTDTSMNIKYRTPPRKIGTITPPVEVAKEEIKKVEEPKISEVKKVVEQEESMKIVKEEVKETKQEVKNKEEKFETAKKAESATSINDEKKAAPEKVRPISNNQTDNAQKRFDNRNQNGDNRFQNRENRFQNRDGNRENRDNRFQNRESRFPNRDGNRDNKENRFQNKENRFQNRDGNRDNRDNKFPNRDGNRDNRFNNRQPQTRESKVEKDIKGILANDTASKEPVKEIVRTIYKDKEKDNRKFEESTKKSKGKGRNENRGEEISYSKLKDIQSESNFSNMFDDTESKMFDYYDMSKRRGNRKNNKKKPTESKEHIDQKIFELTDIDIPEVITVKDLAEKLKKQASEVIKKLMGFGFLATLNQELDYDTAFLVASEFGVTAHKKEVVSDEDILFDDTEDAAEDLVPRPPIVVVMGHVDHGKTSLLDAIRATNVTEREAGGITQHIGAYKVEIDGREITFIDTPGHEAFTAMRARGAQVTDVAIIVVAADDGIMPQTVEAINHAKAAGVSIIVAINKIDREGANIDRVKQEIMEYGLVPEEWGGDVICVPISAKFNKNIDSLLEMVLLVADMKELKSNPNKQAKGTIIEARLDKTRGPVATMLVQRGKLDTGDTIIVGSSIGRIRTMQNDKGKKVKSAGPSMPVEITGLTSVPESGDTFYEVKDERTAKHLIEKRKYEKHQKEIGANTVVTLDDLFSKIESENLKQLNLIVKADVQGSVEALKQSLEKISNKEVRVKVIHANVGGVTESDVTLAKVSGAIIIGFNVRPDVIAKSIADKEGVQIKQYSVIYDAINDVEAAMKGMLDPVYKEVVIGTAEIRQTFKVSNVGTIAGSYVLTGKVARNAGIRVIRDNIVIHDGKLVSLKRFKDDVKEVDKGYECGLQIDGFNDIKEGDQLEVYVMEQVKQ